MTHNPQWGRITQQGVGDGTNADRIIWGGPAAYEAGAAAERARIIAHVEQQMDESNYGSDYRALADLLSWLRGEQ